MTTYHISLETDGVPASSDFELAPQLRRIRPFIAVTRNRLVTIVGQLPSGVYVDSTGLFHLPQNLARDLDAYAEQQAADYRDLADTQADALR